MHLIIQTNYISHEQFDFIDFFSIILCVCRNVLFFGIVMLNDLTDIESKGYRNYFKHNGAPPLVLTITIIEDSKHEIDRKKGETTSRLHYSLNCPALSLNNPSNRRYGEPSNHDESKSEIDDSSSIDGSGDINNNDNNLFSNSHYLNMHNDNLSAIKNQDDYSTILMTCIALTSRAEGSFSITRDTVEFTISCGRKNKKQSEISKQNHQNESDHRKNENTEVGKNIKEQTLNSLNVGR